MTGMEERQRPTTQKHQRAAPMTSSPQSTVARAVGDGDPPARDDAAIIKAGLAAVKEWEAEHGALTDEVLAWADKVLDDVLRSCREPSDR